MLHVEFELRALKQVAVATAALTGAAADASHHATSGDLLNKLRVEGHVSPTLLHLSLQGVSDTLGGLLLDHILALVGLLGDSDVEVLLQVVAERGGVHKNDGVLHEGLGTDQLVVARVVHNIEDTGLEGNG